MKEISRIRGCCFRYIIIVVVIIITVIIISEHRPIIHLRYWSPRVYLYQIYLAGDTTAGRKRATIGSDNNRVRLPFECYLRAGCVYHIIKNIKSVGALHYIMWSARTCILFNGSNNSREPSNISR